jgi:hypothetical protein
VSAKHLGWLALLLLAGLGWLATRPRGAATDEPIDWSREPRQGPTDAAPFELATRRGPFTITPRAVYDVAAVVASTEGYWLDDVAFLSPRDVVLTWGELPTARWRRRISYSQGWRFYFWRTAAADLDGRYITTHSANTHLLPATANLRRAIRALGRGDEVRLRGWLVDVDGRDGFGWHTSLTRDDSGDHGCEILWLVALQIGERTYR